MATIHTRVEGKRGCGYRKPGGLYVVSGALAASCGKLPIPLDICPTCGGGIHFCRSWTWVNGTAIAAMKSCNRGECSRCPLGGPLGRCGLLWIGEAYYKTPADWTREAMTQGVSRRIPAVPRDFKLGETWVLVAHIKCIVNADGSHTSGIFHAFKPDAIEYVVTGKETDDELDRLNKRGITLVDVQREPSPSGSAEALKEAALPHLF